MNLLTFFDPQRPVPRLSLILTAALALGACSRNAPPVTADSSSAASPSKATGSSPSEMVANRASYQLGTKISFGGGGESERYRGAGWSSTETEHTWTEGTSATLAFARLPTSEPLRLQMRLLGLTKPPELPYQPVEVWANGHKVADWQVADKQTYTATIPPGVVTLTGTLQLQLRIPKAVAPQSIGLNADPRILGIECFDLVIDKSS